MKLTLTEDDKYFFDPIAAQRPINFIERYLRHYEDRYADLPFLLLDWQKVLVRDLFGYKHRDSGRRRFQELYLECGKGQGKSPLLTAIACYIFFCSGMRGQQIYSVATDYKQANITFECAKKMIEASPKLAQRSHLKQYEIIDKESDSKWAIISSTVSGKQGFRPNCIVADEAHEWANRKLYASVKSNLFKRTDPLMLVATNAGNNRQSVCWELHERAIRALKGETKDETLYPVIFAAGDKADWTSEKVWEDANPSIGHTISIEDLRKKFIVAKENPSEEADFRRLYLSQWIQGTSKWLDLNQWDKCIGRADTDLTTLPLIVGYDGSVNDDLCSISSIFIGPKKWYVRQRLYVPRKTALRDEDKYNIPYSEWAENGYVRFIDSDTVDYEAYQKFAKYIKVLKKKYQLKVVGYDRAYATPLLKLLEPEITCVRVAQNFYGISPACKELERRLKAGEIVLPKNPCLRSHAESVEVETDKYGNIRPVKEAAKGKYAGRRAQKIDGIVSLVIAISEAMRHVMGDDQQNALSKWSGEVLYI